MDARADRKMWGNLAKGVLLVLGGVAVVMLVEMLYDQACGSDEEDDGLASDDDFDFEPDNRAYLDFVLEGDETGLGITAGAPQAFVLECFDPALVGWARTAHDGRVVQVMSEFTPDQLFCYCSDSLRQRGWVRIDDGAGTRASFAKRQGCYQWLYLDVGSVVGENSAVIVLKGVS